MVDGAWKSDFSHRMRKFESEHARRGCPAISIKVRVVSGCFHREHSPNAFSLIDRRLACVEPNGEFSYVEHESGPELLVWIAVATAGATLAKSVIDLVTAIIKARSERVAKGDHPSEPVESIVRRIGAGDSFIEETVLKIGHKDTVTSEQVEALLMTR